MSQTATGTRHHPHPLRALWIATLLAALAVPVVLALTNIDTYRVAIREDQARVGFGMPLNWLVQDQSSLDPPLPYRLDVGSPLEHPTDMLVVPFVLDVAAVWVVFVGVWVVIWRLRGRPETASSTQ